MISNNSSSPQAAPSPAELDELMATALLGQLTPEESARLDALRKSDPAIEQLYQETLMTHKLLETDARAATPDPEFEQRILSGVKQKLQPPKKESALESLFFFYRWFAGIRLKRLTGAEISVFAVIGLCLILVVLRAGFGTLKMSERSEASAEQDREAIRQQVAADDKATSAQQPVNSPTVADSNTDSERAATDSLDQLHKQKILSGKDIASNPSYDRAYYGAPTSGQQPQIDLTPTTKSLAVSGFSTNPSAIPSLDPPAAGKTQKHPAVQETTSYTENQGDYITPATTITPQGEARFSDAATNTRALHATTKDMSNSPTFALPPEEIPTAPVPSAAAATPPGAPARAADNTIAQPAPVASPTPAPAADKDEDITRKLIRNASLDLEVMNYTDSSDKISALAKVAHGYVDSTSSERGGNGKLQGTIVVKVAPDQLDEFLLKLRELGSVENQSINTEDVTKDYYDIQARLTNGEKTEAQLQDLLQKNNGKVSELLAVERELNRVRGDIESMQGQLKLYDFQVQFATVTISLHEKDLNQAARYILKENDTLNLNTDDVESTYQATRHAVEEQKGQILQAEINRTSATQIDANISASVPPDHIDAFLASLRGLGRVEGLQRHSERDALDGGDSSNPADDSKTEKDNVTVAITIALDAGGQDQVGLTVVTKNVDDVFDHAKKLAADNKGTLIASNLSKDQNGTSQATLQIRVPGTGYQPMMDLFRSSGRIPFFSRNDTNSTAPIAAAGSSPVLLQVTITDDEPPIQVSEISVVTDDVQTKVESLKKTLPDYTANLKSSTYQQDVNGSTEADLVIKLPLKDYPKMESSLKALGRVESTSVKREERPQPVAMGGATIDPGQLDEMAPAEIHLTLHSQPDIVPQDNGLWATLRNAFSDSASALGGSAIAIAVVVAAILPWLILAVAVAWAGRRIYLWFRK